MVWRCCTRVEHGPKACNAQTIPEEELQQAAIDAMNEAVHCKDDTLSILQENVYAAIGQDNSDEIEEINRVIAEKQAELLKLAKVGKTMQSVQTRWMNCRRKNICYWLSMHNKKG